MFALPENWVRFVKYASQARRGLRILAIGRTELALFECFLRHGVGGIQQAIHTGSLLIAVHFCSCQ